MANSTLWLPLKKQWFDMIRSGEKLEEYRDITPYWNARLIRHSDTPPGNTFRRFALVTFGLGYRPDTPDGRTRHTCHCYGITIGKGRREWGASGKRQFIIKLSPNT